MACLGEKVDRLNALQAITAAANQQSQVPGQGGGVATEVEQVGGGAFDDRTLRLLARAVIAAGIDMLVTSSGLTPEPADALDVELMREEVGAGIGVKAVRGVQGLAEVAALLAAGASRVGALSADVLLPR